MRKLWNFPLKLYTQNFRESNIFSKFTKYVSDLTKYFFDESKKHSGVEITDIYSRSFWQKFRESILKKLLDS